jgi:uncharacterized protein
MTDHPNDDGRIKVTFRAAGLTVEWDESAPSLLDFAEQHGINPPFSCRAGVCSSCVTSLKRGHVAYFESPVIEPAEGEILLCCSRPTESIELDL